MSSPLSLLACFFCRNVKIEGKKLAIATSPKMVEWLANSEVLAQFARAWGGGVAWGRPSCKHNTTPYQQTPEGRPETVVKV